MALVKLQNLVLPNNKYLSKNWQLQYRGDRLSYKDEKGCYILNSCCCCNFLSYLNSFSLKKWLAYTSIGNVQLHIKIKGHFSINTFGNYMHNNSIEKEIANDVCFNLSEPEEIVIPFVQKKSSVLSFQICALSDVEIYYGYYASEMNESSIRDVNISIVTTTFKKETYIQQNVAMIKEEVLYCDDVASQHFFLNIIDNGKTLNSNEFNGDKVKVFPNNNVGGSGGYARGMIESLYMKKKPTHVLLMDDDVIIIPEAFKRTYYFLRILKKEYCQYFVSGAMLDCETMNKQHEDIGFVHKDGSFGPQKPKFDLYDGDSVIKNEEFSEKFDESYAGWWYCCIPTEYIEKSGLPLPLFIRGDDVEFSLRNNAEFLTLNGICIWHAGFTQKFNAAMEFYQVHRNSLIFQAFSGICKEIDFVKRITNLFKMEIRRFNYDSCELLLESIDDFMKGPNYLAEPRGEQIMKEHTKLNEKLLPFDKFPGMAEKVNECMEDLYKFESLGFFQKVFYKLTFNGHLYPKCLLSDDIGVIVYDWFYCPKKYYKRKELFAINPYENKGAMRIINKKRFWELTRHYIKTVRNYKRNRKKLEQQYSEQRDEFTSYEFWKKYLGI